ncbi:hypothetical protein VOLCADRAFT_93809 [Volvox carteri f. nagariensis]|uniref:HotDog ACOT-type domain-containing protein n=1 Tax=Volvox carteri f. nagariensis TaxID=3068 RepID=D8U343_VOLCA|nr:uncharacterized protein VOLCADRAFT_93809 [Volvox carteri f. nagariensis]EFJ46011.1 hypothetical protein VOLCADRAFT_93809 [Volvox carteri f. nagariensis]|eukprot:XP_002953089.1 hypothetical protein VOLCADRAFT_93809 [Volvox carteri f. nagariensis]
MPYTFPISGYRSRSFERRRLELYVAGKSDPPAGAGAASPPQPSPAAPPPPPLRRLPSPPGSPSSPLPSPPPPPPPHSYMEVRYPYALAVRPYQRPGASDLDPALIIEDFDMFAADVAARHVGHVPDSMLVTAFLERLTWHVHLRPGDGLLPVTAAAAAAADGGRRLLAPAPAPTDLRMAGQVTWVGRSSMEVLLQLTTAEAAAEVAAAAAAAAGTAAGPAAAGGTTDGLSPSTQSSILPPHPPHPLVALPRGHLVATAEFVMALRDRSLRRAVDVPPLHPRDELERALFQRGREHQRQRQARRDREHRDVATATPGPGKAASPLRDGGGGGAGAPAGEDLAEPQLARMLYDNILSSEFARSIPTDAEGLRVLEPDSALDPPLGQDPDLEQGQAARAPPSDAPDCIRPAKRPRVNDGERRVDDAASGGGNHVTGEFRDSAIAAAGATSTAALATPIRHTEVHRTVIAEFQDRNTSGTVFGGHLLRLAYEHAATAAASFAGGPCELLWMEEGAISAPARVGDMLHAVARVVWSEPGGRALRVVVRVGKYDVSAPAQHVLALTLTAAFLAPPPAAAATAGDSGRATHGMQSGLCGVVPTTLMEAGEALAAQRRHEAAMEALAAAEEEAADGHRSGAATSG